MKHIEWSSRELFVIVICSFAMGIVTGELYEAHVLTKAIKESIIIFPSELNYNDNKPTTESFQFHTHNTA
jgi:hypothetical protein